jgi:hypothetical protein
LKEDKAGLLIIDRDRSSAMEVVVVACGLFMVFDRSSSFSPPEG